MLTLHSYPDLFGVADNNPFALKVFAFLRLKKRDPVKRITGSRCLPEGCVRISYRYPE
jgi:hypothetical protein